MYGSYEEARNAWIPAKAVILSENHDSDHGCALILIKDSLRLFRFFRTYGFTGGWMVSCDFSSKVGELLSDDKYDSSKNQMRLPLKKGGVGKGNNYFVANEAFDHWTVSRPGNNEIIKASYAEVAGMIQQFADMFGLEVTLEIWRFLKEQPELVRFEPRNPI